MGVSVRDVGCKPMGSAASILLRSIVANDFVENRKRIRVGLQVVHRHRIGDRKFRRVSELVFLQGTPKLVLGWINLGGVRMPLYAQLHPAKLRKAHSLKNTYYYDEVTTDPRYEDMRPLPGPHSQA